MQQAIKELIDVLNCGELILYPTDVDWAIGCDATNDKAVEKLIALVGTPTSGSFCILLDMPGKIQGYVEEVSDVAWDLMEITENPLTVIFSGAKNLSALLIGTSKTIGIRVTKHEFSRNLCTRLRRPVVYWSTGVLNFADVPDVLKNKIAAADYQREASLPKNKESVIQLGKGNLFHIIKK